MAHLQALPLLQASLYLGSWSCHWDGRQARDESQMQGTPHGSTEVFLWDSTLSLCCSPDLVLKLPVLGFMSQAKWSPSGVLPFAQPSWARRPLGLVA